MTALILRRLVQLPLILLVIYTVTLALAWAAPGNPLDNPEGRRPPEEVIEAMKKQYNLDNFWTFYGSYLDSASGLKYVRDRAAGNLTPGQPVFDLGPSLQYEDWRVNEIVAGSLPVSMSLGLLAIMIATTVGVGAGVIGAARPGSLADGITLLMALVGISLPTFVLGAGLLLLLGVVLPLFPVGGWGLRQAFLPAVTLSLPFAAYIARLTRAGMLDALGADFVETARAKGANEQAVHLIHALKVAFLPVLSYLGPALAFAMTGSFVVERIFAAPGIGQHFVNGVANRDLFLIIGVVLVFSALMVLMNLAVDVLYRWFDPRIE